MCDDAQLKFVLFSEPGHTLDSILNLYFLNFGIFALDYSYKVFSFGIKMCVFHRHWSKFK